MIDKLEIHHLRTLNALYRFGNISAAAEYLDVSQQAISLQLKKIRVIVNDPLFVRSAHGVTPTPYAALIEPHIHTILTYLNEIPLPGTLLPSQTERTLVISATDYTQTVIVGELINALRATAPGVKVIVNNIESANLVRKMHQGETHLAFTTNDYAPEGLLTEPLFIEQYRCVTGTSFIPPAGTLPLAELVTHDFVVVSPGIGGLKGSADGWFEQQGLRRNVVVSVPSFFMAQAYLKHAGMVGFIPSRLLPADGLRELPLEKYPPGYEVVAAFHPNARHDPLIMWLVAHVKARFMQSI